MPPAQTPATPAVDPTATAAAAASAAAEGLLEGVDYAYLDRVGGQPVRWPCTTDITVALTGPTPAGAPAALAATLATLTHATALPLVHATPGTPDADITIGYTSEDIEGASATAGIARTRVSGPAITASSITLRADIDPTSPYGMTVLTHELGHALGLGHTAADAAEVMAATALPVRL